MKMFVLLAITSLCAQVAMAAEGYKGDAEAGIVLLSGNTESESYNLKSGNKYTLNENIFSLGGEYVRTKAGASDQKKWEAKARYERSLTDVISGFLQQSVKSDEASGYLQKDSTDLGLKYFFIKEEAQNFFSELGLRTTNVRADGATDTTNFARLYVEYNKSIDKTLSYKLWIEHLPNLKSGKSDYFETNYEGSVSVSLSETFSLKTAYKVEVKKKAAPLKDEDKKFTTSLVANF